MASTLAATVTQEWACPNGCMPNVRTRGAFLPNRFHPCARAGGLTAPMVPAGTSAKVELRPREDYVGGEVVTLHPETRRPVMSVVTTRDDGQDVAVFAPLATAHEGARRKPRKLLLPRRRR